jgi:hypothetical protein
VKGFRLAAARLCVELFAADASIADDVAAGHRYNAATSAALVAAGSAKDAADLDERERERWRAQAGDWLRADLALRTQQVSTRRPEDCAAVATALREWQADPDLAGIRDADALLQLSIEERDGFQRLWADVAALLARAQDGAPR